MLAQSTMTMSPTFALPETSIGVVAQMMRDWDTGIIPVVDSRDSMVLLGVITDRDITTRCVASNHLTTCHAGAHMTGDHLVTVLPETPLELCADRMQKAQVRRLPVVEPGGRLVGMLSLADIARKLASTDPHCVASLVSELSQPIAVHS